MNSTQRIYESDQSENLTNLIGVFDNQDDNLNQYLNLDQNNYSLNMPSLEHYSSFLHSEPTTTCNETVTSNYFQNNCPTDQYAGKF